MRNFHCIFLLHIAMFWWLFTIHVSGKLVSLALRVELSSYNIAQATYEVAIQLGWFKNPILIAWYTSHFDNIRNLYLFLENPHISKQKRYFFSENIWKLQIIITDIFPSWDLNPLSSDSFSFSSRPKEWPMPVKRIWHLVYCAKLKINSHLCVQSLLSSFEWGTHYIPKFLELLEIEQWTSKLRFLFRFHGASILH